jgi:rhamnosyltransferase
LPDLANGLGKRRKTHYGSAMHASVVIPTKNPGSIFRRVLAAVLAQETPFDFEVVVVDSGSTDGTVEYVRAIDSIRLVQVAPESFGHGRTRNLAVTHCRGAFIAFLTHDAIPASNDWLVQLVAAVEQAPEIAGAFGRHVAHRDASRFTKRDLEAHFEGFLHHPLVLSHATDPARYERDQGWRQLLHFYSDNNSCLRRSVWERIPYPDVDFAEDQIWAKTVVEAGYAKAYAPGAVVEHSHDFGFASQLRRAFDESNAFRELFGYRLSAGPRAMARSFLALSVRDVKFAWASRIGLLETLSQIARNAALVIGHCLGTYSPHLPDGMKEFLSHDRRLLNSLRTAAHHS